MSLYDRRTGNDRCDDGSQPINQFRVPRISGRNRHLTDILLNAREEFVRGDRGSAKYLNDGNLKNALFDIFGAELITTKSILGFSLIHLTNDVELQDDLRAEIKRELGLEICRSEDRGRMPQTDAFIQEVIRLYPPAPLGVGSRTQTNAINIMTSIRLYRAGLPE